MSTRWSDSPRVFVPPPLIYLACAGVATGADPAGSWDFQVLLEYPVRAAAGWVALAAGLALDVRSLALFLHARTSPLPFRPATAFVERGPYRFTRNPMYLGMTLTMLGIALLMDRAALAVASLAAALVVDRWVVPREERHLEARFGQEYLDYRRRVRRWL